MIARLGKAYAWDKIQYLWQQQGTAFAHTRLAIDRTDSLNLCFALTERVLSQGALDLWQFMALFAGGIDETGLRLWEEIYDEHEARIELIEHHLLYQQGEQWQILPPLASYALRDAALYAHVQGFAWHRARQRAYGYFLTLSQDISTNPSSRTRCAQQLWAMARLCERDAYLSLLKQDYHLPRQLHFNILNCFLFNPTAALNLLHVIQPLLDYECKAHCFRAIGDLDHLFGNIESSEKNYNKALKIYQETKNNLGSANTLQSIGDLKRNIGEKSIAKIIYQKALNIYIIENNKIGIANTLRSLGDIERYQKHMLKSEKYYLDALSIFNSLGDDLGIANSIQSLGEIDYALGKIDASGAKYKKSLFIYKRIQDKIGIANTLLLIGQTYSYQSAQKMQYYKNSLAIYEQQEHQLGIANALLLIGELKYQTNKQKSKKYFTKAINIFLKIKDELGIKNCRDFIKIIESSQDIRTKKEETQKHSIYSCSASHQASWGKYD